MLITLFHFLSAYGITPKCQSDWVNIMNSQSDSELPSYYASMYLYSGFGVNSLGNFESCKGIVEAKYVLEVYSDYPPVVVALCGPKSCTESDYYESPLPVVASASSVPPTYSVVFPEEYQEANYGTLSYGAICMLVFIGTIVTISMQATFTDYFLGGENENYRALQYLLCFSLTKNVKRLFTPRAQERLGKKDSLEFLDGVRVLSIGWVILGHTAINYLEFTVTSNFDNVLDNADQPIFLLGYAGFYAVDTFFWISGVLMAYLFIIEVNKYPSFSIGKLSMVYLHRYLRITPTFMFCTMFFWSLEAYIGGGPVWIDIDYFIGSCDYWYANIIYLSNFIPDWGVSTCLGVGWYLANDMQFYIISTLVLLIYTKVSRAIGWLLMFCLCCTNIVASGMIAHKFELNPVFFAPSQTSDYLRFYYTKPYNRIVCYILGLCCGIIVYTYRKYEETNEVYDRFALSLAKLQKLWCARILSFVIGLSLINSLIYLLYSTLRYPGDKYEFNNWSDTENYTFIALERFVYGMGLSLVLLPVLLGYFTPISRLLSWYPWSVISRFTFTMYLIHYNMIQIILKSQKTELVLDQYTDIRDAVLFFLLSLLFSIPITMLIEIPFMNIERLMFARWAPDRSCPKESDLLENPIAKQKYKET